MAKYATTVALVSLLLATISYGLDEFDNLEVESCKLVSIVAKEIMTARQEGQPLSETLPSAINRFKELLEEIGVDVSVLEAEIPGELKELEQAIAQLAMGAYEVPPFSNENAQRDAIDYYENTAFSECYKGVVSDSEE